MKHFTRKEFACKCGCGQDTVDYELVTVLDRMREYFGVPIIINSGNRCKKYNKKVGGKKNSQHLVSKAADVVVSGVDPEIVRDYLELRYPDRYGIGRYATFTHIDVRKGRARW